ncbi:MAG: HD domain-containing protein, partial [Nitrospirae bacterium]|nr:HD domain-containing protein [Nitrospirota bacterium]
IFQKIPIDLVLLDVHMPDMDGFSVCQKLRNGYSHNYKYRPFVMMMTAYFDDNIDKGFDSGADDFIRKPINVKLLKRRIKNIIDSKFIHDKLIDSELKLSTIFENAQDGIMITDVHNKKIMAANKMSCEMTGYSNGEMLNMGVMDLIPKDDAPLILASFDLQVKKEIIIMIDTPVKRKDRTIFYSDINASFMSLDNKDYLVAFLRDVTQRKNLYKQLEGQRNSLEINFNVRTQELIESLTKLRFIIDSIIKAMALTVEARDPYTAGHQRRVSNIARKIAEKMNLSNKQIEGIRVAGTLHDLGKIQIPSEILSKPSKLNEFEFGLIKLHPEIGYNILKGIEFPWPIADIVRQHHEKIDGSGYPLHLIGDDIMIEAKILCVADVYDAIVSHRPYRPALSKVVAIKEFISNKGVLYDSLVVEAFEKVVRDTGFNMSENTIDM